ncbi:DUF4003 family protein [Candidatus Epulonipiscium viviparus]|uniref:DUF4003 family protein n=1 Tax=Candidatus Epulonipiscium viviparus TaxID=420336 RepID=UPI002738158E|nr:DUF4003 family protein [Candidatus Epulopiscium viviparus]
MDFRLLCEDFILNWDTIGEVFGGAGFYVYPMCSYLFLEKNQMPDTQKLLDCIELFDQNSHLFTDSLSEHIRPVIVCLLATCEDPKQTLNDSLKFYQEFCKHFPKSDYLIFGSMIMSHFVTSTNFATTAKQTKDLYVLMETAHRLLTSQEDIVFAMMMTLSSKSNVKLILDADSCYKVLKKKFSANGEVQSLSHVLALYNWVNKGERVINLHRLLASKKYNYGVDHELPVLGVVAMINTTLGELTDNIILVDQTLKRLKNYGATASGKKRRLTHAAMLVSCIYSSSTDNMLIAALAATHVSLVAAVAGNN